MTAGWTTIKEPIREKNGKKKSERFGKRGGLYKVKSNTQ